MDQGFQLAFGSFPPKVYWEILSYYTLEIGWPRKMVASAPSFKHLEDALKRRRIALKSGGDYRTSVAVVRMDGGKK